MQVDTIVCMLVSLCMHVYVYYVCMNLNLFMLISLYVCMINTYLNMYVHTYSGESVVQLSKLTHGYGTGKYQTLFQDVEAEVTKGERVGFIGPNGSGL